MRETPFTVDFRRLYIVVRVYDLIAGCSVAYLKIEHILGGFVDQIVGVSAAGWKADTHAGGELKPSVIRL